MILKKLFVSLFLLSFALYAEPSKEYLEGLYHGLDPASISEHLALYSLYPDHEVGQKALQEVYKLLSKTQPEDQKDLPQLPLLALSLEGFTSLITKGEDQQQEFLEESHLEAIEALSFSLANRTLKGHGIQSEKELLALDPAELDLARALLIAQHEEEPIDWQWVRSYEAKLDFMALQILARLPKEASPKQIIQEMNRLIFFEMHYRYPALSSLKEEAEPFSRLTTVLDTKRGLCLGTSILYLCLAQRLGLPLEIMIPPGHIFVRYSSENETLNIETTARGINYPSKNYLDVNTTSIQKANLKEVIGFVFFNLAANDLTLSKNYPKAIEAYLKCLKYAPENSQAIELLGYAYALNQQEQQAKKCFKKLESMESKYHIASMYLDAPQEYLAGKINAEAIEVIIEQTKTQNQTTLKEKQKKLQKILKEMPHFKAGLYFLAETYQMLSEPKKALECLEKIHLQNPNYPYVEFSLAHLYLGEYNFSEAWKHYQQLESLCEKHHHHPQILKDFKRVLAGLAIEP